MTVPFEITAAHDKAKRTVADDGLLLGEGPYPFSEVVFAGTATVDGGTVSAFVTVRCIVDPNVYPYVPPRDSDGHPGHPFDLSKSHTITFTENP